MSKDLIVVPAEALASLRWLAGALQAVADEGDIITMDGEKRTIGAILDDADGVLGLASTQPAAGEPVEAKEIGEMTITLRDGVKCFSFEEYSEAYKLPEGLHYLYAAPPAAAPVAAGEPKPIAYVNYAANGQPYLDWLPGGEDESHALFAAPPAAAHGDEAVRKMVLPERIDRRQYLGGRGDAVAQGWNDCLNWIDKANAMRAQGDGEVQ